MYDEVASRKITAQNIATRKVLEYCDPGEFPDHDIHGYEIAYHVIEDGRLLSDVICGSCAKSFMVEAVKANDPDFDPSGVVPIYQGMAEVGDAETVNCDDCNAVIYAGRDLDYDKDNYPRWKELFSIATSENAGSGMEQMTVGAGPLCYEDAAKRATERLAAELSAAWEGVKSS